MVSNLEKDLAEIRTLVFSKSTSNQYLTGSIEYFREWRRTHKESVYAADRRYRLLHPSIETTKINGVRTKLLAPYKQNKPATCELCHKDSGHLCYHHWDNSNPSMGLWICNPCNLFAEAIDLSGTSIKDNYLTLRAQLDSLFKDGSVVRTAQENGKMHWLGTTIGGKQRPYLVYAKRDKPEDSICELCHIRQCYDYHHWDNNILDKGMWLCSYCHKFTRQFDIYGDTIISDYLRLKDKEINRLVNNIRRV